jgi:hypothetical protein
MAKEAKKQRTVMPKAKRHDVLDALAAELRGCNTTKEFEIAGHKYGLRTLTPREEGLADGYVTGANFYQTGRNRRGPYVAAALDSIDGVSIKELFQRPDDEEETMEALLDSDVDFEDNWRIGEVLRWLVANVPPAVLSELWQCYQELERQRNEALEGIGPLSTRDLTGESSLMSALVKGS